MAEQVHVNGPATIKTGTGASSALETLGVSTDGVTLKFNTHVARVDVDTFGGSEGPPFDEQHFLLDAEINARLPFYEESVLLKLRAPVLGGTDGQMGQAGVLYGGGSLYYRLLILSPTASLPWNFLKTRTSESISVKVGTRRNEWEMAWRAFPYCGTSTYTTGAVLFNRTAS